MRTTAIASESWHRNSVTTPVTSESCERVTAVARRFGVGFETHQVLRDAFDAVERTFGRTVAITDKIYLKNHREIVSQLDVNIPKGAFKGATMDVLYSGEGLSKVDSATPRRLLDFAQDFLDCDCEANPHCGCAERKDFAPSGTATTGAAAGRIVAVMSETTAYAYPGDVLSILDNSDGNSSRPKSGRRRWARRRGRRRTTEASAATLGRRSSRCDRKRPPLRPGRVFECASS